MKEKIYYRCMTVPQLFRKNVGSGKQTKYENKTTVKSKNNRTFYYSVSETTYFGLTV